MEKKRLMTRGMNTQHVHTLTSMVQVLHNHESAPQHIGMKKKMIFMLRKCATLDCTCGASTRDACGSQDGDANQTSIVTAAHALMAGIQGRCADGQISFFESWLTAYWLNSARVDFGPDKDLEYLVVLCCSADVGHQADVHRQALFSSPPRPEFICLGTSATIPETNQTVWNMRLQGPTAERYGQLGQHQFNIHRTLTPVGCVFFFRLEPLLGKSFV
jgi:hypothetical protein